MKLNSNLGKGIGILAIAMVAFFPFVSSNIYNGFFAPITVTNNNDINQIPIDGNLVAYGDVNSCVDSDNGIYPDKNGSITYFSPRDMNTHFQVDMCDSNTSIIEMACIKDIKVNGVQYQNYFIAMHVACSEVGKTTCVTQFGSARCV